MTGRQSVLKQLMRSVGVGDCYVVRGLTMKYLQTIGRFFEKFCGYRHPAPSIRPTHRAHALHHVTVMLSDGILMFTAFAGGPDGLQSCVSMPLPCERCGHAFVKQ